MRRRTGPGMPLIDQSSGGDSRVLAVLASAAFLLGCLLRLGGWRHESELVLGALVLAAMIRLGWDIVVALRHRQAGVDLIAFLALVAAILQRQWMVGAIIALMLTGGRSLEQLASGRARRALQLLIARAPSQASRYQGTLLEEVPVPMLVPGNRLFIRTGEIVPVDGYVAEGPACLDESALTGEPTPVQRARGEAIASGVVNAGSPFDMVVLQTAEDSSYARVVRLAEQASASRTPMSRLADRYALIFIPLTLSVAAIAWWMSGDPLRGLAVLVVATPCPLLLAVPVAMVGGMSRCARMGVLVKRGAAFEALAHARVLLVDKTGTLTRGRPRLQEVDTAGRFASACLLGWAASLAQASTHGLARAAVIAARARELRLSVPRQVVERAGSGLRGQVAGHAVALGSMDFVGLASDRLPPWAAVILARADRDEESCSFLLVDGQLEGLLRFDDPLRSDAPRSLRRLRRAGVERIVLLTGDRPARASAVASAVGADAVEAGLSPEQKLQEVIAARKQGTTLMIGDGINDAPALAAADVGVAMAGEGGLAAAQEAADIVVLDARIDRVADALLMARHTTRIAAQSAIVGMVLSLVAMVFAALGMLAPLFGALVQEVIDVAAIGYALRVLIVADSRGRIDPATYARLHAEHQELQPILERVHIAAQRCRHLSHGQARQELGEVVDLLEQHLLPHEQSDERQLYPGLANAMGGDDPLAALSHGHREIFRLYRILQWMRAAGDDSVVNAPDEIERILVRLDTLLKLHFADEDELFDSLAAQTAGN